jgi:hypothetical protein
VGSVKRASVRERMNAAWRTLATGTMGDSDSCIVVLPRFDDPNAWLYLACARSSLLAAREHFAPRARGLLRGSPIRLSRKERCRSPRFLEDPCLENVDAELLDRLDHVRATLVRNVA